MCGIAGIVIRDPAQRVDEARLVRMRDTLAHRGPDGAGVHIDGPVGLAHRRLAIVDLAGGAQPMSNEDGTVWIVFNGEIYNHAALRPALEAAGHRYRTRSDTETILHLYEQEGIACVERLQGMFAFAIWDARRRRLVLARDRFGIKPLYYVDTGHELLFASEIKALLAAGAPAALDEEVVPELLASGYIAGAETLFRGVKKLMPGCLLTWSAERGSAQHRYWQAPRPDGAHGEPIETCARDLRERLDSAVESHLMSDVPLGVFLSGGLDSTGIAALAARHLHGTVETFAVGFAEHDSNELPYARIAADALGTDHHEVVVSASEFFTALPRLVWHEDEPLAWPSSVALYFVSRLASDRVKVVLTGEGADELFVGYNRYRLAAWNARLGRMFWSAPAGVRSVIARAARAVPRVDRYVSRSFLALRPEPRDLYYESSAVFSTAMQRELLAHPAVLDEHDPYAVALSAWRQDGELLDDIVHADVETYLVELLMKQDQMSMAASIESRVPFLDHLFAEHALALPSALKLRGLRTKAVLRDALADVVPPEILHRRKMGFPVPLATWLRGEHQGPVRNLLLSPRAAERGLFEPAEVARLCDEHAVGARDHSARLWLLLGLELWQRIFLEGESPSEVWS